MRSTLALATALLLALPGSVLLALDPARGEGVEEARIYRDAFAVPHVFASDAYALFYANGYAQAQDRLFLMDILRHVGRGNAASVLGAALLPMDLAARRDFSTEEERLAKFLATGPEFQLLARAYSDGVNRALAEMAAQGNLPAEFVALNHAPEPWTPLDTVAIVDFLLERFGSGGGDELANAQLLARLREVLPPAAAEAAFHDVVWGIHATSYPTIPDAEGSFQGPVALPKAFAELRPEQAALLEPASRAVPFGLADAALPPASQAWPLPVEGLAGGLEDLKWGSNALLVAPSLSREGRSLVGGGPQTGYFNPPILYEVGLHGAGVDAVGVGVAGTPGIVLGRTANFAWTVTSGISDQTDIVALPAVPGKRAYLWDGEERALRCRDELHIVAQPPALGPAPPQAVHQEVCESHVGTIIAATPGADGAPEVYWAAEKSHRGFELATATSWLGLDSARGLADFAAAFDAFRFTFNFHYAGPEGICYFHVGAQPVRAEALDPRFPRPPGEAWAWEDVLTGDAMPRACGPAQGYFANWNNLPQRGWGGGDSRELWGSVHRAERLDKEARDALLASPDGKLGLEDVQGILREAATHDSLAAGLVPLLLPHAPPAAAEALAAWATADYAWRDLDRDGLYDDMGHAWYDAVRVELQRRVLGDELGPFLREWNPDPSRSDDPHAADHGRHDNKDALLVDALAGNAGHAWCDDASTPAPETCGEVVGAAFAAAGTPGPLRVHNTTFTPVGAGPAYRMGMTNRATYYHFHDPVGDAALPQSRSGSAIPPGQSGHLTLLDLYDIVVNSGPGPVHMRDQLPLYERFELKAVPVSEAQAAALSGAPLVLAVPRPPA